jgi:Ca2+-binding EF-hand superfamily protein
MKKCTMTAFLVVTSVMSVASYAGYDNKGHKNQGNKNQGNKQHSAKKFSMIDTNTDGLLSKEEVLEFHGKRFTAMDADSDGFVSKTEMKSHRKQQRRDKKSSKGSDTES